MKNAILAQFIKAAHEDAKENGLELPIFYTYLDPQTRKPLAKVRIEAPETIPEPGQQKTAFAQLSDVSFFSGGDVCRACGGTGRT